MPRPARRETTSASARCEVRLPEPGNAPLRVETGGVSRTRTGLARLALLGLLAVSALGLPPIAGADLADETALAERYAPVVRLVAQPRGMRPRRDRTARSTSMLLFDEPTVALRGPVEPRRPRQDRPGSERSRRAATSTTSTSPATRSIPGATTSAGAARLAAGSDPDGLRPRRHRSRHPGKLALQYWFFYAFNDFNNTHEGDWEMIQLIFDAPMRAEALSR